MSSALAIASVTAVLKDLLNNGLIDHNVGASVGEVTVSTLPPDRVDFSTLRKGALEPLHARSNPTLAGETSACHRETPPERIITLGARPPLFADFLRR
jgi:hypothetical protein